MELPGAVNQGDDLLPKWARPNPRKAPAAPRTGSAIRNAPQLGVGLAPWLRSWLFPLSTGQTRIRCLTVVASRSSGAAVCRRPSSPAAVAAAHQRDLTSSLLRRQFRDSVGLILAACGAQILSWPTFHCSAVCTLYSVLNPSHHFSSVLISLVALRHLVFHARWFHLALASPGPRSSSTSGSFTYYKPPPTRSPHKPPRQTRTLTK